MADGRGARWRWSNVPLPEPHIAGLLVGAALHALAPWRLVEEAQGTRFGGRCLVAGGLGVVAWAVRSVADRDVALPDAVVTDGPYAYSRNPMYVAWTALYAGVALLVNSAWLFVVLPAVLAWTHVVVREEERSLERTFGAEYRDYRRDVRRYV